MPTIRSFTIPTIMKHGLGAIAALGDEAAAIGMQRPLLVTDPGIVRAGLLERAIAPLKAAGLDYVLFDGVAPNPPAALAQTKVRIGWCTSVLTLGVVPFAVATKLGWTVAEFEEIFRGRNKTFRDYKNNLFLITLGTRIFNLLGLDNRIFR